MSGTTPAPPGARRVRHDVRDGLVLMAVSLATSTVLAVLLTTLVRLGD